jgi:hypothetical protein
VVTSEHTATAPAAEASGWRRWTSPRTPRASLGSGLLGGLCCIAAAITTAAGLGAAGFFTALMEEYQLYFILGSIAVMAFWLVRHLRRQGISPLALRAAARAVGRHAVVMGVVYVVTLGIAIGVAQLLPM